MVAIVSIGVAIIVLGVVLLADRALRSWTSRDLVRRAMLVSRALAPDTQALPPDPLRARFDHVATEDRVIGIIYCGGGRMIASSTLVGVVSCNSPLIRAAMVAEGGGITGELATYEVHISAHPVGAGRIVVIQDRTFLWARRRGLIQIALIGGGLALIIVILLLHYGAKAARRRTGKKITEMFRRLALGERTESVGPELSNVLRDLNETVARLRAQRQDQRFPGPERLRRLVAERMPDTSLVVVANREPYMHVKDDDRVALVRPASGLVTGVEPLVRACGGSWVAHGSGSADRETADAKGRLAVPPQNPEYVLRRVWLTAKEEEGYYYGFSNEGLWPLCHIAHARPTFREEDWEEYKNVNRRFAQAAAEEGGPRGLILVQDYHFALLPAELRRLVPDSVISLFWHIPWPNHEVVGICPWKQQLLEGMLAADVIGFHTRFHCLNFLDTAQRYLECRVELESMSVEYQGHRTRVKPYPISIEWPFKGATRAEGESLRRQLGIDPDTHVALGVDRADYTKGLLERIAAVEKLLSDRPELLGKFMFVQLAAPSRTHIKRYRDLISELEDAVTRVNRRFGRNGDLPILLQLRHHSQEEVKRYYAMADSAVVTPLHDGMNLVAKEYVASCADEKGALVLSQFAGAAKELEGALIVNPYDAADVARAIHRAVTMPEEEQRARISSMRAAIEKNTIYDWSAKLLSDMAEIWARRNATWREQEKRHAM